MPIEADRVVGLASTQSEAFVPYTIASRGRPIGTTELDFMRIDGSSRSGWFHPNALGETLMPTVALVLPAMRAFVCRDVKGEDGQSIVQPSFRGSSLFADLAEALHRVAALELTLHHQDGTIIPTQIVGIQDTEQLLALTNWSDVHDECDAPIGDADEDPEPSLGFDVTGDLELSAGSWPEIDDDDFDFSFDEGWLPEAEPNPEERYQVHVLLSQENAIP